ncbi:MAG: hypothetical protein P1Q69_05235 [Candidatus Thorarchaeota archaeon]|nr:hypothetical protein [Candidatus Thorarchaeota archaeon]
MIITVTTVVVLVIGILSIALALYGGYISSEIVDELGSQSEQSQIFEQKYYLLGMIGTIVLLARLVVVPIYFWMLQSLVPYCPGAMCVSGVTNVSEPYSTISMVLKIILTAAYGMWLLVEVSNRRVPTLPFLSKLARSFLLILLPMLLIDSAADVLLVASIQPVYAPCCSSVYDVDPPFSPSAMLGPEFGMMILALTVIISITVIMTQWLEPKATIFARLTLLLSLVAATLYLIAIHDTLAPVALGLSNHHCPYCLFQEFPDTALFAGLFWVGIASACWRVALEMIWTRRNLDQTTISGIVDLLRKISSVSILFSMVSLVSHILVAI